MNENIQMTCDLILKNRDTLLKSMFWEMDSNDYALMAAMITAANGVEADESRYKECKKILHKHVSGLSEIRGIVQAAIVTRMTMVTDPEDYIQGVQEVYRKLRSIHKLMASHNMVIAAMNIYEHVGVQQADEDIQKMEDLYKTLKKAHPLLIDDSDRPYLSMLITAGVNPAAAAEKIETAYEAGKKLAFSKDSVHSLAQILALSSASAQAQCQCVRDIIRGMRDHKKDINKSWALPAISALALLNMPAGRLVADIVDADNYLTGRKGFKWYSVSPGFRRIYAILAVFMTYAESNKNLGAAIGTNITMTITEALIVMIIVATTTASASASSSVSSN